MTEMRLRKEVNQTVQTTESYVYGTLLLYLDYISWLVAIYGSLWCIL